MFSKEDREKVAVVYHYLAHYREPIFRLMCQQMKPAPEYTIFSDYATNDNYIKAIDPEKAMRPSEVGGIRWRFLKNIWFLNSKVFLWQRGLLKIAWSREFDAIIFLGSMYFLSTWAAAIIARIRGKRVMMWTHGFVRRDSGLKGCLRRTFYRLAHGIFLYGNWAKKMMIGMGFNTNQLYLVFNSLDYDSQRKLRKKITEKSIKQIRQNLFANPDWPIILFIGRLSPKKKLEMVVDAVEELANAKFSLNVLIIGEGSEYYALRQAFVKARLKDRVKFYGACHNEEELAPLIAASDLCVSPGEVGLTAIHSLSYGTPIVTHDNPSSQGPEFEAIIQGINGNFFREGDTSSLALVIREWLTQTIDRNVLRGQCYEVIDKYYNPYVQMEVFNAGVIGSKKPDELPLGITNSIY